MTRGQHAAVLMVAAVAREFATMKPKVRMTNYRLLVASK